MDSERFDRVVRAWSRQAPRRTALSALAGVLVGLSGLGESAAKGKGKGKNKRRKDTNKGRDKGKSNGKGKNQNRANAQAEPCWRAGACIPRRGANVSRCDLAGYTAPPSLDCTGCNLSRANLRDASFIGTNFTRANLSGACLVDADFTGATFANNTNLANAIFCNTTMPDGTPNNSGCASGTACCPTSACTLTTCAAQGVTCGEIPDGCGGTLQCGGCPAGQRCCAGQCPPPAWTTQTTFGSAGSGPSQFQGARDVAVSGDTLTACVADTVSHRIAVWTRPNASSTTWTNQTTFGSVGNGPSQFSLPVGVAVSGDTLTVWVADTNNHRIAVWTRPNAGSSAWTNQTTFGSVGNGPSQFSFPAGVAVSGDTLTVWVADTDNHRIAVWTRPNASSTTWTTQTTFGSQGNGPSQFQGQRDVAVSGDTLTIWVADTNNRRVSIWTRPNASSTAWTNQTTFGSQGNGPSQFQGPRDVAVSGDMLTVWVADTNNHRIAVWTRPNASSTAWTNQTTFGSQGNGLSQFSFPPGVAVSGDGLTVWVANNGNNRISVWALVCLA